MDENQAEKLIRETLSRIPLSLADHQRLQLAVNILKGDKNKKDNVEELKPKVK